MFTTKLALSLSPERFATSWCNAFLATGEDENRPVLCQTLSIEFFERGLQVIGCDGTMLLRCWVPSVPAEGGDSESAEWPDIGEDPDRAVVVMDTDGFGLAFVKAMLRVAKAMEQVPDPVVVTIEDRDMGGEQALGSAFAPEVLTLQAFGQRLSLTLMEGQYPDWRHASYGLTAAERVEGLTIAQRMFSAVGKLKGISAVDCEFHGENKSIVIQARGEAVDLRGLLMPMRRQSKSAPKRKPLSENQTTVTFSSGGESVTMTGEQFDHAARNAGKALGRALADEQRRAGIPESDEDDRE